MKLKELAEVCVCRNCLVPVYGPIGHLVCTLNKSNGPDWRCEWGQWMIKTKYANLQPGEVEFLYENYDWVEICYEYSRRLRGKTHDKRAYVTDITALTRAEWEAL